jgi:hypothetical protein
MDQDIFAAQCLLAMSKREAAPPPPQNSFKTKNFGCASVTIQKVTSSMAAAVSTTAPLDLTKQSKQVPVAEVMPSIKLPPTPPPPQFDNSRFKDLLPTVPAKATPPPILPPLRLSATPPESVLKRVDAYHNSNVITGGGGGGNSANLFMIARILTDLHRCSRVGTAAAAPSSHGPYYSDQEDKEDLAFVCQGTKGGVDCCCCCVSGGGGGGCSGKAEDAPLHAARMLQGLRKVLASQGASENAHR